MRIQKTSQFLTVAILTLSVLAIACAIWSRRVHSAAAAAYETRRQMSHAIEQLKTGSDRLTASVRAYAATGNRNHHEAFQRELTVDRNRERAVEELRRLGLTQQESELLTRA